MSACREFRRAVRAAMDEGRALSEGGAEEHAAVCRRCRKESDEMKSVLAGAAAVRGEIDAAMRSVDWDGLSSRIAEAGLAEKRERDIRRASAPPVSWASRPPRRRVWRPLLAGAAAGLVVGVLATALMLRRGPLTPAAAGSAYAATGDFLQSVELELAKREAIGYLEESEYLLLDLLERKPEAARTADEGPGGASRTTLAARDLLARKRYFNAHLDDVRIAKARALCDQIEVLLLELARTSRDLAPDEADEIRRAVEDKQILLQIRLLKKELRSSEA